MYLIRYNSLSVPDSFLQYTVNQISEGDVETKIQPQDVDLIEAPKLNHDNTRIDWRASWAKIDSLIRGLDPYPSAWTILMKGDEEMKMKMLHCRVLGSSSS